MADSSPTLAGYTTFCRDVAGIDSTVMPDNDPGFATSLLFAEQWAPCELQCMSPYLYTACVYNMGVSLLVQYQPDQSGQTFFADLRNAYKTNNFVPGVVSTTADQATSTGLTVGTQLSNLSLFDLQHVTDPFGRQALAIAGALGPYVWGLS